jgi:hypothetical protein
MVEEKRDSGEESGFKVTDKRHFTSGGDVVPGSPEPVETDAPEESATPPPTDPPPAEPPPEKSAPPPESGPEEKVDFTHLVGFLASNAAMSLGAPAPDGQKGEVNLQAASLLIDLLAVIEEKTKGNLTAQEEGALNETMTGLRTAFIQASGFVK